MNKQSKIIAIGVQILLGGLGYGAMELLFRGRTHISMLIAGGLCLPLLILISKTRVTWPVQSLYGAMLITAVEFTCGCVVNLWLKLGVWDYSAAPFNLLGQICAIFFVYWYLLCAIIMKLCHMYREEWGGHVGFLRRRRRMRAEE